MKKILVLSMLFVGFALVGCTEVVDEEPVECDLGFTLVDGVCVEDEPDPDPDPEPSQGVTDTTVKVGNSAATSGFLAFVGTPFNQGIQAYFDMVNANGGVNGREIEFISYDDQFDGAVGRTNAEKLLMDDEVFAFVGHFGTPTVSASLEYLIDAGIPQVYYATGISALFNENAFGNERASFPVQPIYDAEGQVMVARAVGDFGATKIGVIYTNDDAGMGISTGIRLQARAEGVTLVEAQVAADAVDMSSAAQTIINGGVDIVIVAANQIPAEVAIKALGAAGNTNDVLVSYVNAAPSFIANIADELANFDVYANAWLDVLEADGVTPTAAYNEFITEISKVDAALAANPYAMAGWIAAAFFVEGLERVGTENLTWENYILAMEESPVANPFGGTVDYADGRRAGTQSMSLLLATIVPGEGEDPDTYVFAPYLPLETIDEILTEE
jgi:ABC-type branched-subunit amino acid transport system substrate-binding protein